MANQQAAVKNEEVKDQKHDLFVMTLEEIRKIVPEAFTQKENKSGVTWFGEARTRLMKIVETKKGLRIEFNVKVSSVPGLTELTEAEAKAKHMGTCRWIYSGNDLEAVKKLVQEAVKGFEPKKRADSKEEKDKKKAPKAEVKEQPKQPLKAVANKEAPKAQTKEAPKAETKANRKLTPDELKQLNKTTK